MKKLITSAVTLTFVLLLSGTASAQAIAALTTNNQIVVIPSASLPTVVLGPFPVTGLVSGQTLEGIDYRPHTGELFAIGYNNASSEATLYTVNQMNGQATPVNNTPVTLSLVPGEVGFDFNPTVDRIRVTSSNGNNYRLNPNNGALAATDGNLAYANGDPNNGMVPDIVASAYTNSYIGTETTTLYNLDASLNILVSQIPPNNGTLNTIGSTGMMINNASKTVGFDIYYDPATSANIAYVSADTGSSTNDVLFSINLTTGQTTPIGLIGLGLSVSDIAVSITRNVPALQGVLVYGLSQNAAAGNLISWDSQDPQTIRTWVPLTGITAGQQTVGMDFRPMGNQLYVMGYNPMNNEYQLYTVNTATGVATVINSVPGTLMLDTTVVSFDFNPTVDRIRVIGLNGKNYRLNPVDGSVAGTDTDLDFATGDVNAGQPVKISTVAYTNSYPGATSTELFAIDESLGIITTVNPPNNGVVNTLKSTNLLINPANFSSDLDIYYDSTTMRNIGFYAANVASTANDNFYVLDFADTTFSFVERIGYGIPVKDIAAVTGSAPALSLDDQEKGSFMRIYPNPAEEYAFLSLESVKGMTGMHIRVTDLAGKQVSVFNLQHADDLYRINVQGLIPGIYIVSVFSNDQMVGTTKLIKK